MSWRNRDKCVKPGPEYSGVINFNPRFKEILKPFLSSLGSYNQNFFGGALLKILLVLALNNGS